MDLSIIIVSFNTKQLTLQCIQSILASLKQSPLTFEIIVVDNGSIDQTVSTLKKKFSFVKTIVNSKNMGFGAANNVGIMASRGTYILLLNSDTIIVDNAIDTLVSFGRNHPNSFIGPKLLNPDGSPQFSCGPFFSLRVVFTALFLQGDILGLTRWSPKETRVVDWVSGACILAQRKLFLHGLLFDDKLFMYMEDIDMFMRAAKLGYVTYFYPESCIIHVGAASSVGNQKGPVLNIYRGLLYIYKKHGSSASLFVLRMMLKLKAIIALSIGILMGKSLLKETYAEAYQLV